MQKHNRKRQCEYAVKKRRALWCGKTGTYCEHQRYCPVSGQPELTPDAAECEYKSRKSEVDI